MTDSIQCVKGRSPSISCTCRDCVTAADTQLIKDLTKCVDDLMPGIGHVVIDIGLLNETMIAARKRLPVPE